MFGRNKNRRRTSWKERLGRWLSSGWDLLRRAAPWVAAVVVAVGLPYAAVYLYLGAASSTHFDISKVTVKGAEYLDGHRMARRAHIVEGMNVLDIDGTKATERLESSPWVTDASVDTQLPGEAVVTITERDPVALLPDARWALVDESGTVFKYLEAEDPVGRLLELPMITGLEPGDLRRDDGQRWLDRSLRAAELYRTFGLDETAPLSEIHVDETMGVSLVTRDGTEIRLGRDRYRQRLGRLGAVRKTLETRDVDASYILMDLGEPLRRVAVGRRYADHGRSAGRTEPASGAGADRAPTGGGADETKEGH